MFNLKNRIAHRKALLAAATHNQSHQVYVNMSANNSSSLACISSSNSPNKNINNSQYFRQHTQKIMNLRRSSANETMVTNQENHNQTITSISAQNQQTTIVSDQTMYINSISTKQYKVIIDFLQSSFPDYFNIPRSTRKRILRFLCDNGWIDIS